MGLTVQTVTVLGAGTMGSALAGLLSDAGLQVHLLDLPSGTVKKGVAPDPRQRNQLAKAGLERMLESRPTNLYEAKSLELIQLGNLEDDFEAALIQSDWVLEAITENLSQKRDIWRRIEACCPSKTFVSTNTSGLPISLLTEGLKTEFRQRCFGTHFFNPPRYLPLMELIPGPETDPSLISEFKEFAKWRLGREVVGCNDSPYFIGNRFFAYHHQATVNAALAQGISLGEVDALTGSLLGRPKTATFRLADIVGLDVMEQSCSNMVDLLPADSAMQAVARGDTRKVLQTLTAAANLGRKSGQGFYKTVTDENGVKTFLELDLDKAQRGDISYLEPAHVKSEWLRELMTKSLTERLTAILFTESPYRDFAWDVLGRSWGYLATIASEIANSVYDIDRVMRWGFGWKLGPFEAWDAIGLSASLKEMDARGIAVPQWVRKLQSETIFKGHPTEYRSFHRGTGEERQAFCFDDRFVVVHRDDSFHCYQDVMGDAAVVAGNGSATLRMGRDQFLLLEFHSKLNTIDDQVLKICQTALEHLHGSAAGLLITNDDEIFSAGANLQQLLHLIENRDWSELEQRMVQGQSTLQALREAPKPVVVALRGLALGGGVEFVLASDRVVAHRDARLGLVESSVGLIPGWGGCKEMVRRSLDINSDWELKVPELAMQTLLQMIGSAQVSRQAEHARAMGLLALRDSIVNRSSQVLTESFAALQTLQREGYRPPVTKANVYAGGKDMQANLNVNFYFMREGEYLTDYDCHIASKLTNVLSGGNLDAVAWMDEQYFLDLEREAILSLLGEAKTQARMGHMLATGKPLAN